MNTEEALSYSSEKLGVIRKLAVMSLVGIPIVIGFIIVIQGMILNMKMDLTALFAYLLVSVALIGINCHKEKRNIDKMIEDHNRSSKDKKGRSFNFR
jgi:archaellum biogenesis protein FlaJ (TadC family)